MIVLLGRNGLFGQHFTKLYPDVVALSRQECDLTKPGDVLDMLKQYRPTVLINAAGVVPKAREIHDPFVTLQTNSLGPKLLADLCGLSDCRVIHLSSNDVFSGRAGKYRESDFPNPTDLYGISKMLGEVTDFPNVTVRCSFVGFPDEHKHGLLAWAATQVKAIGYDRVLWNGLTAPELARLVMEKVVPDPARVGVVHMQGETISKYDLIKQAAEVFNWTAEIVRESDVAPMPHVMDRTLLGTIVSPKTFRQQLEEMRELWA